MDRGKEFAGHTFEVMKTAFIIVSFTFQAHPIKQCADDLNTSEKTIQNHNKLLVDHGLIARLKKPGRINVSTFLLPIGYYYKEFRSITEINYLITNNSFNAVYGQLKQFIHIIFKQKDDKHLHYMAIVTEKEIPKQNNRLSVFTLRMDLPELGVKAKLSEFTLPTKLFDVRDDEYKQFEILNPQLTKIGVVFNPEGKPDKLHEIVPMILKGDLERYTKTDLVKIEPEGSDNDEGDDT